MMRKLLAAIAGFFFVGQVSGQQVQNVDVTQFKTYLDTYQNYYLIDVRTPQEFAAGKIPGAVNINVNDPQFQQRLGELDPSRPVLVYCLSGGRSTRAARLMTNYGFTEVFNLQGGISGWKASGEPIEK
ncbi:MAG: rhodanese-like domain-containing protein [Bacteroidota bacterium]